MFGFLTMIPGGVKMALLAGAAVAVGLFYWHYTSVVSQRNAAMAQVGALQVVEQIQDATIQAQTDRIIEFVDAQSTFQATLKEMTVAQEAANATAKELNDVLSKHNLTRLSLAKPGLIENRINAGTANVLGLFQCASGGCDDDNN